MNFPNFLLLLIQNFIPLWLEKIHSMILISSSVTGWFMALQSILANDSCVLDKNVSDSSWEECSYVCWFIVLDKPCTFWLILCVVVPSIMEHRTSKNPTFAVELFWSLSVCFIIQQDRYTLCSCWIDSLWYEKYPAVLFSLVLNPFCLMQVEPFQLFCTDCSCHIVFFQPFASCLFVCCRHSQIMSTIAYRRQVHPLHSM